MMDTQQLSHTIGAFSKFQASQKTFEAIMANGLLSRKALENSCIIPISAMKGLLSDEHENIYFCAEPHPEPISSDFSDFYKPYAVAISVDPQYTWVYNSYEREAVNYFGYQASRMRLSEFLSKHQKAKELETQLQKGEIVFQHYITGDPVIVHRSRSLENSYSGEVPMHLSGISPDLITVNEYPAMFSDVSYLRCGLNASVAVWQDDRFQTRGIFLNDEGTSVMVPSRNTLPDTMGTISLSPCGDARSCPKNITQIDLRVSISPNYVQDAYTRIDTVIKGDDRDNVIKLGDFFDCSETTYIWTLDTIILGGAGADLFCLQEAYGSIQIVDFDPGEGDRLIISQTTKESQIFKAETGTAVFILPPLGAVILPGQTWPLSSEYVLTEHPDCV